MDFIEWFIAVCILYAVIALIVSMILAKRKNTSLTETFGYVFMGPLTALLDVLRVKSRR
jgi:hypothetical protein